MNPPAQTETAEVQQTAEGQHGRPISVSQFFKFFRKKLQEKGHTLPFYKRVRMEDELKVILSNGEPTKPMAIVESLKNRQYLSDVKDKKNKASVIRRDLSQLAEAGILERVDRARYRIPYNIMEPREAGPEEEVPHHLEPFVRLRHELEDYDYLISIYRYKRIYMLIRETLTDLKKQAQGLLPKVAERNKPFILDFLEEVDRVDAEVEKLSGQRGGAIKLGFTLKKLDSRLAQIYNISF